MNLDGTNSCPSTFTRGSRRFAESSAGRWNLPNLLFPSGYKELQRSQNSSDLSQSCRIIPKIPLHVHLKLNFCHISFPFCLATSSALLWAPGCAGHTKTIPYPGHTGHFPALGRRQRGSGLWWIQAHFTAQTGRVSRSFSSCTPSPWELLPPCWPQEHAHHFCQILFYINTKLFALSPPSSFPY